MRVIATTLLVYLAAVAAVFGTQFAAVIALMARRARYVRPGARRPHRPPGQRARVVPGAHRHRVARGRPLRGASACACSRAGCPRAAVAAMIVGILSLSQALESLAILVGVGPGVTLDWIARTLASASPVGLAAGDPRDRRPRAGRGGAVLPRLHADAAAPGVERGPRHPDDRDRLRGDSRRGGARRAGDGHRDLPRAGHRAIRQRDPRGDLPRGQQRGLGGALGRVRLAAGLRRRTRCCS